MSKKEITFPSREPDVVLPHTHMKKQIEIWIDECVFRLDEGNVAYRTIMIDSETFTDPVEYLEHVAEKQSQTRSEVALRALAELSLLKK